jgi:hypothetical protein
MRQLIGRIYRATVTITAFIIKRSRHNYRNHLIKLSIQPDDQTLYKDGIIRIEKCQR